MSKTGSLPLLVFDMMATNSLAPKAESKINVAEAHNYSTCIFGAGMKFSQILKYWRIVRNMGWRYTLFRLQYEWLRRSGWLKLSYPTNPPIKNFITLDSWRQNAPAFFFHSRESLPQSHPTDIVKLKKQAEEILQGTITFFNVTPVALGLNYDWVTNPFNGKRYNHKTHWTDIPDFDPTLGDIKLVWEKSRFSYLPIVARFDQATGQNHAEFVFSEIESWIKANPINCGPNYRCSQEISIRILNWTFLLYFYRNAPELTPSRFERIMHHIYWQIRHVRSNIQFSRIAVRNNHAITETLLLYVAGCLFPFFPEASEWKKSGKKWFEEEIAWQIFEDGTYLQYSMNYHRVVVQLLTWALKISSLHNEKLADVVYQRAEASLKFLCACLDPLTGELPNYGANDGALFFNWSTRPYRDYRPALNALYYHIHRHYLYPHPSPIMEEAFWFGCPIEADIQQIYPTATMPQCLPCYFDKGGYWLYNNNHIVVFLRAGNHLRRPGQADNHHFDLRVNGVNVLRDAGSYLYNVDDDTKMLFSGTAGHNVLMLPGEEQMLKGPRFTWLNWTQCLNYELSAHSIDYVQITSTINAYSHLHPEAQYTRRVTLDLKNRLILLYDHLTPFENMDKWLNWHIHPEALNYIQITVKDNTGKELAPQTISAWFSNSYGQREPSQRIIYQSKSPEFFTTIKLL